MLINASFTISLYASPRVPFYYVIILNDALWIFFQWINFLFKFFLTSKLRLYKFKLYNKITFNESLFSFETLRFLIPYLYLLKKCTYIFLKNTWNDAFRFFKKQLNYANKIESVLISKDLCQISVVIGLTDIASE